MEDATIMHCSFNLKGLITQLKVNQSESKAAGFDKRSCYFLNVIAELRNESRDLDKT